MTFEFPRSHEYGPPSRRTAYGWSDPPQEEVGMPVGFRMRVGQGNSYVTFGWFVAYSTGFEFQTVASLVIPDALNDMTRVDDVRTKLRGGLNVEMVWPDGQTLRSRSISDGQPDGPALTRHPEGGSGGETHWREKDS